jgi:hypothetical protein
MLAMAQITTIIRSSDFSALHLRSDSRLQIFQDGGPVIHKYPNKTATKQGKDKKMQQEAFSPKSSVIKTAAERPEEGC